jgi:antitoxin MazE
MAAIKTKIIEIGNSQGVRLPLNLLEQAGIKGESRSDVVGQEIEVTPTDDGLLLRAVRHPREGWEEQFAAMAEAGDDVLLDETPQTSSWDEREWTW